MATTMNIDKEDNENQVVREENSGDSASGGVMKRFTVRKWQAQAVWAWDINLDTCAICRNKIMDLCNECQAKPIGTTPQNECTVAWGACNHAFHYHCISRWLKSRSVCPLDNKQWDYQQYGH